MYDNIFVIKLVTYSLGCVSFVNFDINCLDHDAISR